MKALSCTQPWAQLIVAGWKKFETRSWDTGHRGLLAIHASKGFPKLARELCYKEPFLDALGLYWAETAPLGSIIGVVQLKRAEPTIVTLQRGPLSAQDKQFGNWGKGRYAWTLSNPVKLTDPIPVKGMLRLWTLPAEIEVQVNEQLSRVSYSF